MWLSFYSSLAWTTYGDRPAREHQRGNHEATVAASMSTFAAILAAFRPPTCASRHLSAMWCHSAPRPRVPGGLPLPLYRNSLQLQGRGRCALRLAFCALGRASACEVLFDVLALEPDPRPWPSLAACARSNRYRCEVAKFTVVGLATGTWSVGRPSACPAPTSQIHLASISTSTRMPGRRSAITTIGLGRHHVGASTEFCCSSRPPRPSHRHTF
ncbi:hypothetical protein BV20DRAFT_733966 [Pilatotrama ljubarskyi]|nr:hypothetical protein BV20DRAFT_733966 [Pilatotrama ljubarskyi]